MVESLIDTRSRKRPCNNRCDSVQEPSSPSPPVNLRATRKHLGDLLRPTPIPNYQYNKIQGILDAQDEMITNRGAEIEEKCSQINMLKRQLAEADRAAERDRDRIDRKNRQLNDLEAKVENAEAKPKNAHDVVSGKEFRERKQYYEDKIDELNDIMTVGKTVLAEQNEKTRNLQHDNDHLRVILGARDNTISALNLQLLMFTTAPSDSRTEMRLEAQAQQNLALVKGQQNDIAERDTIIENYKAQLTGLSQSITNKQTQLEKAEEQAAKATAITEDQSQLISRLLKENERLSAN